ncbi:MAG: hypothetical protein H7138_00610 [Myxococcales bacterium]|nr:hypothetical protein [Myxococcales bacterium]
MRTLAVLLFIVGAALVAVLLARTPTVADGRVMAADLLEQLRVHGVAEMECDREIPIGLTGAVFTCVATLANGATQTAEYTMDRTGNLSAQLKGETDATPDATPRRIRPSGDPWAN